MQPLGRVGHIKNTARAVLWLAHADFDFGAEWRVDGGHSAVGSKATNVNGDAMIPGITILITTLALITAATVANIFAND